MFQLTLNASLVLPVYPATGPAVARVTDLTDWSQAVSVRGTWAIFLSAQQVGSIQAQDSDLLPASYEPHTFQSGSNPAGTVDIPLPGDGVFAVRGVAVPVLLDAAEFALATAGRVYYRLDNQQFVYKASSTDTAGTQILGWEDIVAASATDLGAGGQDSTLLEKSGVVYLTSTQGLEAGLATLNLRYLEANARSRTVLQQEYSRVELLVSGAQYQAKYGFYADASTSLTAAQRVLGACLPGFAASLPAIGSNDCGCN